MELRAKYTDDAAALAALHQREQEPATHRRHSDFNAHEVFVVCRIE